MCAQLVTCTTVTHSEFCTPSELVLDPHHSLQQSSDTTLPLFEILPAQNGLAHVITLFEYMYVKNIPLNFQLIAQLSLWGVSITMWSIATSDWPCTVQLHIL